MEELTLESAIEESVDSGCEKTPGRAQTEGRRAKRVPGEGTESRRGIVGVMPEDGRD